MARVLMEFVLKPEWETRVNLKDKANSSARRVTTEESYMA